jgi:HPr kinase/phosphorylase
VSETLLVHATTISLDGTAVMIRGESGSGKSDLALQVLETQGSGLTGKPIAALLVADDQTLLRREGNMVLASSPQTIKNLLEVRGQGIMTVLSVQDIPLVLVVDLTPKAHIERMPQDQDLQTRILGLTLPRVAIDPGSLSAAARLRTAWATMGRRP